MNKICISVFTSCVLFSFPLFAEAKNDAYPVCYEDTICDGSKIFSEAQTNDLYVYHKALLDRYDIDLRVVVMPNAGDISQKSVEIFKSTSIGEKSKTRKGVLLLIDPTADEVRMEISAGLDAVYTDGFVTYLQRSQMVPFFKANRVSDGILATTELIVERAQDAQKGEEFISPEHLPDQLAIGAGAKTKASIGTGYEIEKSGADVKGTGLSPAEVVAAYHQVLEEGNMSPDLSIYSKTTQDMKKNWVVTKAQMKNELNTYRDCTSDRVIERRDVGLAIVRYPYDQRKCAPYFLTLEDGEWKLDFSMMMQFIKFNIDNEWHFNVSNGDVGPLYPLFDDWVFDRNGYPHLPPKLRWGMTIRSDYRLGITYVDRIFKGTPAESLGLELRDQILKWDGLDRPDYQAVIHHMDQVEGGKVFEVIILREGQEQVLKITAPPLVQK